MNTKCRTCGLEMSEVAEEVDIGVGTQRFVVALHCETCDDGVSLCGSCAAPDDEPHREWCGDPKGAFR